MTSGARICFLICPMGSRGSAIYERSFKLYEIVSSAVKRFGFETECFLEPERHESIRQRMTELIRSADICIADLTDANANVFFEYGWRKALGRPVLAFIEQGHELPFDVDDFHTETYDLNQRSQIEDAIESFLTVEGLGERQLRISSQRFEQNERICEFIIRHKPHRLDILHFSLFTIVKELITALWQSPNTAVCVLLMDPEVAVTYAAHKKHSADIKWAEDQIADVSRTAQIRGWTPPTIGLWHYAHEPSVAAIVADTSLVQMGWYFRAPVSHEEGLLLSGHSEPALLALGQAAQQLAPKLRDHFKAVWRDAMPGPDACFVGSGKEELIADWRKLKMPTL